jgi:thymidylate synthase (FAD)
MKKTPILDHGYIELIETWGSDERIVEAARMSTGKGFLGWGERHDTSCPATQPSKPGSAFGGDCNCKPTPGDEKLLRYLWENKHATPFEMAGATFEIQAPIFVFREWHRHRTQSYNEMSARYTPLPELNYIPTVERLMLNAKAGGKQAGTVTGAAPLTVEQAEKFRFGLRLVYDGQQQLYEDALSWGIPKELARVHLPVGRYSRMRASANLRNWLAFLTLRSTAKGPGAQWEIRQYADALHSILSGAFPRTLQLFDGGVL